MASQNSSRSSGGDPTITSRVAGEIHPRGILSAIGYMEESFENEKGGCMISAGFLTTLQRTEFFEVGLRSGGASCLVMTLLSPLALGVHEHLIPMFGSYEPSLFDQFNAMLLALIFSLSSSFLMAWAATRHLGGYSKAMVTNLLRGVNFASISGAGIVFILFHFIYFKVLSDDWLLWAAVKLSSYKVASVPTLERMYNGVISFKPVILKSAYFVVFATILSLIIPMVAFQMAKRRNQRWIDAGVVEVFDNDQI